MSNLPTISPSPPFPSLKELKMSLREAFATHAVEWDFLPDKTLKSTPDDSVRGSEAANWPVPRLEVVDVTNGSTLPFSSKVINIQPKEARPRGQASLSITSLASIGHSSSTKPWKLSGIQEPT
jgi:hypothetical protein